MPTTRVQLSKTAWTDCGTTPCYIQNTDARVAYYVIDTAAPAVPAAPGSIGDAPAHILQSDGDDFADVNISLASQRVYARGEGTLTISR